jgi:hypothetical protein
MGRQHSPLTALRRIGLALLGATAFAAAAESAQPAELAELLALPLLAAAGPDPDAVGIMQTACYRRTPIALFRKLIAQGADVNRMDRGQSPLHACAQTCAACITVLAESGAKVDQQDDLGRTPLHLAWDAKNLATAEALLRAGANPNIDDRDGRSPYWFALYQDYRPEMAELMARYGGRLTVGQRVRHFLRQIEPSNLFAGHHR